jgi:hypothetical protein
VPQRHSIRFDTFKLKGALSFDGSQQPWEALQLGFAPDPPIPSMICKHELKFLHYLTKFCYAGVGAVVELGPLAGSSTYALLSGMTSGPVHSYDLWAYCTGWEMFTGGETLPLGTDIQPYFQANIAAFKDRVIPHKSDLGMVSWTGGPIEILFIDAAKSPELMRHIADEFFPKLVVGAYVIQQDWVSAGTPWIHVAMGKLGQYFEIVDSPEGGTVCFRVVAPIPENALASESHISDGEHFEAAIRVLPGYHGLCVRLSQAHHAILCGEERLAVQIAEEVRQDPKYSREQVGFDMDLIESAFKTTLTRLSNSVYTRK